MVAGVKPEDGITKLHLAKLYDQLLASIINT
jgi:hypothetical protein